MIAMPSGQAAEQLVDLGLGGDVDAAGRLVDDQILGSSASQRQHHLLLVAAREIPHELVGSGHANVERALKRSTRSSSARSSTKTPQRTRPPSAVSEILLRTEREEQGLLLAILRHEADAGADRIRRRADRDFPTVDPDAAALERVAPKMARASSVRPEPMRPAIARISPRRTDRSAIEDGGVQALPRAAPAEFRDFQHHGTGCAQGQRREQLRPSGRPSSGSGRRPKGYRQPRVPTSRPSRSTVARSQRRITSSSRWVTKMMPSPDRAARGRSRTGSRPRPLTAPRSARP